MDKQKQIEEMAKVLIDFGMATYPTGDSAFTETKLRKQFYQAFLAYAEQLHNAGYRKIPEGAVVLTEKEYKRYERIEKIIKLAKRERANGYEVKNDKLYYFTNMLEGFEYEFKDLQEICDTANHYNEEFFGLQQRVDFWKVKAEETRKETAERFAERLKEKLREVFIEGPDGEIPMGICRIEVVSIETDDDVFTSIAFIDEILKEITEEK